MSLAMVNTLTVPSIRCKIVTGGVTKYSMAIPVTPLEEKSFTDNSSNVSVAGILPSDATLTVSAANLDDTGLNNGVYPVGNATLLNDVTLYRGGNTYQPEEGETVTVTFPESSVTGNGFAAGDAYHVYHIHDGVVDLSEIRYYNGGNVDMTFSNLSVVGISEATLAEKDLVEQHGEIKETESISQIMYIKNDPVVLYDTPESSESAHITEIKGCVGAEVEAWQKITYEDNFVVYRVSSTANTPTDLSSTIGQYPIISADDLSEESTGEPTAINTCAICGKEMGTECVTPHVYCTEHKVFDCVNTHEKPVTEKPITAPVIPANPTLTEGADVSIVDAEGNAITAQTGLAVPEGTRASLSAWSTLEENGNAAYQWQIRYDGENWTNIQGKTEKGLVVSPAMVNSITDPALRCEIKSGDTVQYSDPIPVTVETPTALAADFAKFNLARMANGVATVADEPVLNDYSIVINYVFENNDIVADPYTATLAAGSNFSTTVKHPVVQGYLPYVDNSTETSTEINLNITDIQANKTYTVTYKPTNVDYTIIYYQQNVDNDNFTEVERVTAQGFTGSTVPVVDKQYAGFYQLLYNRPVIAADGSTVVEVYYDRNYYLMIFNLGDGGYGVDPIYDRFGAPVEIGTPTRPGYTFSGWSPAVPDTVPVDGGRYNAVWKENETAKVSVVIWGENADDEKYSYIKTTEFYAKPGETITYASGNIACGYDEEHTHNASCYDCGMVVHTHSADCCTITAHTHGAGCCTITAHTHSDICCSIAVHTHGTGCYANVGAISNGNYRLNNAPDNPEEGQVYYYPYNNNYKYIYINDNWYRYNGSATNGSVAPTTCGQTETTHADHTCDYNCGYTIEHEHNDGNCVYCTEPEHTHNGADCTYCDLPEHTHSAECLECTEYEHTHSSSCYISNPGMDSSLWTYVRSDEVTVAADGSTVMNVYYDRVEYTFTFRVGSTTVHSFSAKWDSNIREKWTFRGSNGTTYSPENKDSWTGNTLYTQRIYFVEIMPARNITFTRASGNNTSHTFHYYVESLPDTTGDKIYEDKYYDWQFDLVNDFRTLYYDEDFFELSGFTRYKSARANGNEYPLLNSGTSPIDDLYFYYTRNKYDLEFFNPTTNIGTVEDIPYESPMSGYYWEPDSSYAPEQYEPGSVQFAGWYLNPECTGEEFDFTTSTMPLGTENGETSLTLYAKWEPVTRTVEFYLDKTAMDNGTKYYPDQTTPHGSLLRTPVADPENGKYTFVGWFYIDDNGKEQAFLFTTMVINKDMKVYGKWSSNVLMPYTVYFKYATAFDVDGNPVSGIDIAAPIQDSDLAGTTKTFDAKAGTELYAAYQTGYYPMVESHSFIIDIDDATKNTYTFWYVKADEVPYTVYYVAETLKEGGTSLGTIDIDGKTYYLIAETYRNEENTSAVVTEKFVTVPGYMPDAYQKRLVLTVDADGDPVEEKNIIVFYYTVDTEHAYYQITHYTQNTDGTTWTEYASSQAQGDIGRTYTADPLTIDGFTYDPSVTGTVTSGVLTANGLELKLYYVRNQYPYEVRYLEQGTGKQLAPVKPGKDLYGKVIAENAIDIDGYTPVDPTSQTLVIKIEESQTEAKLNIITFYYTENTATINYVVVGPEGCGTVSPESETLKVLSGTAQGSTATAGDNYHFVGWYDNAECTGDPISTDANYVPTKPGDVWVNDTYYALFEYNLTSLTITKEGANTTLDPEQTFIFNVTGDGVNLQVVIKGEGSATITGLTVGKTYNVTELESWSWRYTDTAADKSHDITLAATDNEVVVINTRDQIYWLDGNDYNENTFSK